MVSQTGKLPPNAADFVVKDWIGFDGNHLAEFTHRELTDFFRRYADLPDSHPGVLNDAGPLDGFGTPKHTRFVEALDYATPRQQAAILAGILQRLPVNPAKLRTQEKADKIRGWIHDLERALRLGDVEVDSSASVPGVANEALRAASDHMAQNDHHLALDRLHTALHACVRRLAQDIGVDVSKKRGLQEQFAAVRKSHPAFAVTEGDKATFSILRGVSRVFDALNLGRNDHSLAHPTDALLRDPEARLFCNAGITVLQYILDRLDAHAPESNGQPREVLAITSNKVSPAPHTTHSRSSRIPRSIRRTKAG